MVIVYEGMSSHICCFGSIGTQVWGFLEMSSLTQHRFRLDFIRPKLCFLEHSCPTPWAGWSGSPHPDRNSPPPAWTGSRCSIRRIQRGRPTPPRRRSWGAPSPPPAVHLDTQTKPQKRTDIKTVDPSGHWDAPQRPRHVLHDKYFWRLHLRVRLWLYHSVLCPCWSSRPAPWRLSDFSHEFDDCWKLSTNQWEDHDGPDGGEDPPSLWFPFISVTKSFQALSWVTELWSRTMMWSFSPDGRTFRKLPEPSRIQIPQPPTLRPRTWGEEKTREMEVRRLRPTLEDRNILAPEAAGSGVLDSWFWIWDST